MDTLIGYLDTRDAAARQERAQLAKEAGDWQQLGESPEMRKVRFDSWLRGQLDKRLVWPSDQAKAAKLRGQIEAMVETMLTHFYGRGWLLDGKRLAAHVEAVLDEIGAAQRAGRVRELYPFARKVLTTYTGAHAEEIQREAQIEAGRATVFDRALGLARAKLRQPGIVEVAALTKSERVRERIAKARAAKAAADAEKLQQTLL